MLFKDKIKKFFKGILKFFCILIIALLVGFGFYNSSLITEGRKNQLTDLIGNDYISSDYSFKLTIKDETTLSYRYSKKIDGEKVTIFETKNFKFKEGTFFINYIEVDEEGIQEEKELKLVCLSSDRIKFLKFNKTLYLID